MSDNATKLSFLVLEETVKMGHYMPNPVSKEEVAEILLAQRARANAAVNGMGNASPAIGDAHPVLVL